MSQAYQRLEFPLSRPLYRLDAQVKEFFVPDPNVPYLEPPGPIAIAMVVTYDGQPIYALTDRVISCVFGQRTNCRWGR